MDLYKISIPNLYEKPYTIQDVLLNNKVYYFEYFWNIRHIKAYLSIYILDNNIRTYILRNTCLTNGMHISKNIKYDNWVGDLYFTTDKLDFNDYNRQDITSNFYILYRNGTLEVTT